MSFKDGVRGVFTSIEKYHSNRFLAWRKAELTLVEYKNLYVRRDEWKQDLSPSQKKAVDDYFMEYYGKKVPYYWHRMYTNYTGTFDKKYFPEILFSTKLEEKLNPFQIAFPLQNKAFCPQCLFAQMRDFVKIPELRLKNSRGTYWTSDGNAISVHDALDSIRNIGEAVIKPTIDTMGARGVRLINLHNGIDEKTGETAEDILGQYNSDFIIQERVKNHVTFSRLYPHSINTIRVITFITQNGGVKLAPLSMRIGMGGREVDNGGIFIGVSPEGKLYSEGFSKKHIKRFKEHPDTGIAFAGYELYGIEKISAAAVKLHAMLPQLKMLSWDMTIDENGNVVIIEVNTTAQSVWFPQMVTGKSIFGDYTSEMLRLIR